MHMKYILFFDYCSMQRMQYYALLCTFTGYALKEELCERLLDKTISIRRFRTL